MDASSGSVILRLAQTADIPEINSLGARVFTSTFGHSVESHQLEAFLHETYTYEATDRLLTDPDRDLVVAVSTSERQALLGFALLTRNSSEACIAHLPNAVELQRIYVDSACHGKGVGGQLARHLETMAREQGFEHMWLGVWEENHKAHKVYQKLGYEVVGEHDFIVGDVVQRDLVMAKSLY